MTSKERIFSINTANFFYEMVTSAEIASALKPGTAIKFLYLWLEVDWSSKESIRPIIGILEQAYIRLPRSQSSPHRELDAELAKDGFRIRNGKLGKPQIPTTDAEKIEISLPTKGLYESRQNMGSNIEP